MRPEMLAPVKDPRALSRRSTVERQLCGAVQLFCLVVLALRNVNGVTMDVAAGGFGTAVEKQPIEPRDDWQACTRDPLSPRNVYTEPFRSAVLVRQEGDSMTGRNDSFDRVIVIAR